MQEVWFKRLGWVLLIAGAALRLGLYLADNSLWFDEAALAEQLLSRPFAALGAVHRGDQCAPLGFLFAEKALTTVFGSSEYVLRALPCLGALAALLLFWRLARVWLTPGAQLVSLWLVSTCWPLIRFGAQVRVYSTDVAVALALLLLAWRWRENRGARAALWLALAGGVAVWFSFAAVFVLAALGLWLLVNFLREGRRRQAAWVAVMGGLWLCSFGVHYLLFVREVYRENSGLIAAWADAFAPLPTNWDNLGWYWFNFWNMFNIPGGLILPQFAAVVFVLGGLLLFRNNRRLLALLILPLGLDLLASALHKYPFGGRVILFAAPLLLVVLAEGLTGMLRLKWRTAQFCGVILLLVFGIGSTVAAVEHVLAPSGLEEMRPVMARVAELCRPGDKVLANPAAAAAINYYARRLNVRDLDLAWGADRGAGPQGEPLQLSRLKAGDRVWLLSHYRADEKTALLGSLSARGEVVEQIDFPGAKARLFRIKAAQ